MATNIFSPISGKSYTYGAFNVPQQTSNIFNGVNPYYVNNTNTYVPTTTTQPVAPTAPVSPIQNGDDSFPDVSPTTSNLNLSTSPGYGGPYNQGNPLSDLGNNGFSFGGFFNNFDPVQAAIGFGTSLLTGSPLLGFGAGQLYNDWNKKSFALEPNQVGVAPTFSTQTAQDFAPGGVNYAGTGGADNYGYGAGSGYNDDGSYAGTDAGDAAAANAGEEDSGGSGYASNATGGF